MQKMFKTISKTNEKGPKHSKETKHKSKNSPENSLLTGPWLNSQTNSETWRKSLKKQRSPLPSCPLRWLIGVTTNKKLKNSSKTKKKKRQSRSNRRNINMTLKWEDRSLRRERRTGSHCRSMRGRSNISNWGRKTWIWKGIKMIWISK